MNSEKPVSIESIRNSSLFLEGVSILVVDGDSTCLTIISKMLHRIGYKVVTAKRASDALSIVREKEDDLNLVLTEAHLPDMDKYEFLERMGEISKLPVVTMSFIPNVVMSADDNENAMLGSLFKGAMLYLVKPITLDDIKNLWQFALMKNSEKTIAADGVSSVPGESSEESASDDDTESQLFENTRKQSHQKAKRKVPEETDKDEEEEDYDSSVLKKPKLIWTNELHNRFLQAIKLLGIDRAHPKKILQHMNVPGLKKGNVSSHLQLDSTHPNSSHVGRGITSNELAGFGQIGNSNGEETLSGNMDPFSMDNIDFGDATHCLALLSDTTQQEQLQQQQQFLQQPYLPPPLPLQPPQEPEEHDIFGVERGEIDELFDLSKDPNNMFLDEDLDDLW
uniref:Response regulatory domain-containing protein n=1 Tax=Fagus sylvatica TaxID=28930 RepID=A0A2N9JAU0_FAGSY